MSAASAQLVVHLGNGRNHVMELGLGQVEVGRAPGVGLRLAAPEVSSRHAELSWDGTVLLMRDLGSAYGTFVNGRSAAGWTARWRGPTARCYASEECSRRWAG